MDILSCAANSSSAHDESMLMRHFKVSNKFDNNFEFFIKIAKKISHLAMGAQVSISDSRIMNRYGKLTVIWKKFNNWFQVQ